MRAILFVILLAMGVPGFCQKSDKNIGAVALTVIAESTNQWTGVSISKSNRIFVTFPRWSGNVAMSVGEIVNGKVQGYPNTNWNAWNGGTLRVNTFVCVQSVSIDEDDHLWVLDTGYEYETDTTKGAHIYVFNLKTNQLIRDYALPALTISGKSYLNDLQIDPSHQVAFLSDTGMGGIGILHLESGSFQRVLDKHPSTLTEVPQIVIEGYVRKHPVQLRRNSARP